MLNQCKNIKEKWKLKLIDGKAFNPKLIKYNEKVPECKDFVVFEFQKSEGSLNKFRLYWCKYKNECHKLISSPSKFYDHLRSHTKDTPFKCGECTHSFSQKANLNQHHLEVHQKNRPYLCEVCRKRFSKKYNLKAHSTSKSCYNKKKSLIKNMQQ